MKLKMTDFRSGNTELVDWSDSLSVGIKSIDEQHRQLLEITNALFTACLEGEDAAREFFIKSARKAAEYVQSHFRAEEALLEKAGYPGLGEHRAEHEKFVKELIAQVRNFEAGLKFVPNNFARFLRDWVLTHIAIMDKKYALFFAQRPGGGVDMEPK